MKKLFLLILLVSSFSFSVIGQQFAATSVNSHSYESMNRRFSHYSLYRINTAAVKSFIRADKPVINFNLELPGLDNLKLSLTENDILSADYTLTVATNSGRQIFKKPECMTYAGNIQDQSKSKVRLTITDDIIYGIIRTDHKEYFIEPLHYLIKDQSRDIFVVYETKDVQYDPALTCGVTEAKKEQQRLEPAGTNAGLNCVRTEMAIASDVSMLTRYGSAAAVQTHNIGVMNNVIWDYTNAQFNNNIEFVIAGQNVSTSAATDQLSPAYTGTNSGVILPNFRTWGEAGNFGFTYDLAQIWTIRDIDTDGAGGGNGVIGLAYVGVVCTNSRYQLLEDFAGAVPTGSGYSLRVLTSHETGHNFGASHDAAGTPYIMAPSVQNTVTWSPASIASVDAHIGTRVCLAQCSASGATVTDFIATPGGICAGGTIQFTDHTLGGPTSWSWTFAGGTPSTSTVRNPSVTFAGAGIKSITLTTDNGSGPTSKTTLISVSSSPATACTNTGAGATNAGVISFSLGSINKITSGTATDGNKYMDFSCTDNTILSPGTTYSATAEVGTTNPSNQFNLVQLYIDYNNDGDFADVNEAVYSSPLCYIGGHTFSFTTPALAAIVPNVLLRARVIAKDCVGGVNSCYNVTNGQVEDYAVIFMNVVPVKLISFGGYHKAGKNLLNWKTSAEINTAYFEIERSTDGINYNYTGRQNTYNGSAVNNYNFTDDVSNAGSYTRFYYRLKIMDADGHFTHSNIAVIDINKNGGDISIYPNPVKRGNMLGINLQDVKSSGIEIINSVGQVIYKYSASGFTGSISIPVSTSWAAGQYVIRIIDNNRVRTQKLMIY